MLVCSRLCKLAKVLCTFNSFFIKSSFLDYAGLRVKASLILLNKGNITEGKSLMLKKAHDKLNLTKTRMES